jgi:hypothetical protein
MGPVALTAALAAAVVAATALVVTVALLRSARAERERLDRELLASRDQVAELGRRVTELSQEVGETRRAAAADHDYVITTLGGGSGERPPLLPYDGAADRPAVGRVLQDQLVGALARHQDGSRLRARAVDLAVRTVALGAGVRRALSPDVLDRAAAEAHVARRRSRRDRRRELREARRVVRGARLAREGDPGPAGGGRREDREDAA